MRGSEDFVTTMRTIGVIANLLCECDGESRGQKSQQTPMSPLTLRVNPPIDATN